MLAVGSAITPYPGASGANLPLFVDTSKSAGMAAAAHQRRSSCKSRPRLEAAPMNPLDPDLGTPPPPPPFSRTKWTRRVPHPVLIGHAASLTPY